MPDRTIELVLPKRRVVVRARLLEGEAPTVCQLIWERLPLELPVKHGIGPGENHLGRLKPARRPKQKSTEDEDDCSVHLYLLFRSTAPAEPVT